MKKLTLLLIAALFVLPLLANASIIGDVTLKVKYTTPNGDAKFPGDRKFTDNMPLDYEGSVNSSAYSQVFCVENQPGPYEGVSTAYTLLTIDATLKNYGVSDAMFNKYLKATAIAQYYWTNYENTANEELMGAAAQVAIWEILFDSSFNLTDGNFKFRDEDKAIWVGYWIFGEWQNNPDYLPLVQSAKDIWEAAVNGEDIAQSSDEWALAVNPLLSEANNYSIIDQAKQNYLVRYQRPTPPPVPEPASLLLFGLGLLGLAGVRRKMKK